MYRYILATERNIKIDDVIGIERLLAKMEYNALTENGRIASDYGVPFAIVEYFEHADDITKQSRFKQTFDSYERGVFNKIKMIINE